MANAETTMWDELDTKIGGEAGAALEALMAYLKQEGDPHHLFDARLMKWKFDNGLPVMQPTSVADVPREKRSEFEQVYIEAARETGKQLLERKQLTDAWMYFRAIDEPETMAEALESYQAPDDINEEFEEILQLALYQRIHPAKGVSLMLSTHGMCNTVTAVDQLYLEMKADDRSKCAEIMVKQLYDDLAHNVRYEVEQRSPMLPPDQSLTDLIAGRQWLFENENYHIDVSHLNAVVRFARSLEENQQESIEKAIQLCDYGARLAPHLQYPGEPPFDDYYVAHKHYFQIVGDKNRDESLEFFRERMHQAEEPSDRELIAYVLVDLLMRLKRHDEAVDVAEKYLGEVHEQSGFSFVALCEDTKDMDALQRHAKKVNNPVLYVAAQLQKTRGK